MNFRKTYADFFLRHVHCISCTNRALENFFLLGGNFVLAVAAAAEEIAVSPLLQVVAGLAHLPGTSAKENPFAPLPRLDAGKKQRRFHKDDAPFPRDACVFEDIMVEDLECGVSMLNSLTKVEGRKLNSPECRV